MAQVSWRKLCEQADEDFMKDQRTQPGYRFSNNRTFRDPRPPAYARGTDTST
jgi:hypothetical protein